MNTKTGGANGSIRYEEEYTHGSNAGLKIAIDLLGMHCLYSIRYWMPVQEYYYVNL